MRRTHTKAKTLLKRFVFTLMRAIIRLGEIEFNNKTVVNIKLKV